MEQPGFGVQPSAERVVLDADLGTELAHESVQRFAFRCAHIGRGNDPEGLASFPQAFEFGLE